MKLHFRPETQDLEIESDLTTVARTVHLNRAECVAIIAALNPLVVPRIAHLVAQLRQQEQTVTTLRSVGRTVTTTRYTNPRTGTKVTTVKTIDPITITTVITRRYPDGRKVVTTRTKARLQEKLTSAASASGPAQLR